MASVTHVDLRCRFESQSALITDVCGKVQLRGFSFYRREVLAGSQFLVVICVRLLDNEDRARAVDTLVLCKIVDLTRDLAYDRDKRGGAHGNFRVDNHRDGQQGSVWNCFERSVIAQVRPMDAELGVERDTTVTARAATRFALQLLHEEGRLHCGRGVSEFFGTDDDSFAEVVGVGDDLSGNGDKLEVGDWEHTIPEHPYTPVPAVDGEQGDGSDQPAEDTTEENTEADATEETEGESDADTDGDAADANKPAETDGNTETGEIIEIDGVQYELRSLDELKDYTLEVGEKITLVGTLTGVEAGTGHQNTATIEGTSVHSGTKVEDFDPWNALLPTTDVPNPPCECENESPKPDSKGAVTGEAFAPGGAGSWTLGIAALLLLAAAGGYVLVRRRNMLSSMAGGTGETGNFGSETEWVDRGE